MNEILGYGTSYYLKNICVYNKVYRLKTSKIKIYNTKPYKTRMKLKTRIPRKRGR